MRSLALSTGLLLACAHPSSVPAAASPSPPPATSAPCADLDISVLELDGRVSITVGGARYVARAIPVTLAVDRVPADRVHVGSNGSLTARLASRPRAGALVTFGYADGGERRVCRLP